MAKFADTIFKTPDQWGETTVTDGNEMQRVVKSMHKLGDEWKSCDINECEELRLVKGVKGNIALYERLNVRNIEYLLYQKDGKYYTLYRLPGLTRAGQFFVETDDQAIEEANEYLN